jgi:multiple sugar transport system substrate-binding protein
LNEILFSIYSETLTPLTNPDFLLKKFEDQHNARVRIESMQREEAWSKLLDFALHGGGPHISIIGAIWTGSLQSMNTLRPFSPLEIAGLGGTNAFFPSTWENALLSPSKQSWAIPFNAFTYLLLYRRDLLEKAGIDENKAFISSEALLATLDKLKGAGVMSPIVLPSGDPFSARINIASSWIWGAGGDYLSIDGKQVLLTQDQSLNGLTDFYNLYRYLDPSDFGLTQTECQRRFAAGRAAILIAGSNSRDVLRAGMQESVLHNLGVVALPGVPWVAGANIVIWREAQFNFHTEQLSLALTKHLTSTDSQVICSDAMDTIPVKPEAFDLVSLHHSVFKPAIRQSLETGRTYIPVSLWTRMLNQLRPNFDLITTEILENPGADPRSLIVKYLEPLSRRFGILLSSG